MGLRIGQRSTEQLPQWTVDVVVKRGATVVDVGDFYWKLPFLSGVGLLAWEFTMPGTVPGTGNWTFECAKLAIFDDQDIGTIIVGDTVWAAHLVAGVITTNPSIAIAGGNKVTIRGLVTV